MMNRLSDTCDLIETDRQEQGVYHNNVVGNFGEYSEYVDMIREDYSAFMNRMAKGKFVKPNHVTDRDMLEVAHESSNEDNNMGSQSLMKKGTWIIPRYIRK